MVPIHGSSGIHVPRESVYDTELMRILYNWLKTCGWSVIGQRHTQTANGKHRYSDIVLEKDGIRIVLELLATGDAAFMKSKKNTEYVALHSAVETPSAVPTEREHWHIKWFAMSEKVAEALLDMVKPSFRGEAVGEDGEEKWTWRFHGLDEGVDDGLLMPKSSMVQRSTIRSYGDS